MGIESHSKTKFTNLNKDASHPKPANSSNSTCTPAQDALMSPSACLPFSRGISVSFVHCPYSILFFMNHSSPQPLTISFGTIVY